MLAEIQMKDQERAWLDGLVKEFEGAGRKIVRLPGPGEPRDPLPPPAAAEVPVPADGKTMHLHRAPRRKRAPNHQDKATVASWERRQELVAANGQTIRDGVAEGLTPGQIGKRLGLTASMVRSIAAELSIDIATQRLLPPPPPPPRIEPAHASAALGGRLMAMAALGMPAEQARREMGLTRWQFDTLAANCNIQFQTRRRRA